MKRLGDLLLELGWISNADLRRALDAQRERGGRLGTCLLEVRALEEKLLSQALAQQQGVEAAKARDLLNVPKTIYGVLPPRFAVQHSAVPFRLLGKDLWVALQDPSNLVLVDEIAFATGHHVRPHVAPEFRLAVALESYYHHPPAPRFRDLWRTIEGSAEPTSPEGRDPVAREIEDPSRSTRPVEIPIATVRPLPDRTLTTTESGLVVPAPSLPEGPPPELAVAVEAMAEADDRDGVAEALLDYLARRYRRAALFTFRPRGTFGWMGRGAGFDHERLEHYHADDDEPSVFLNLRRGGSFWAGYLPRMPAHERLFAIWNTPAGRECLVYPVDLGERRVAAIYCAPGPSGLRRGDLEELSHLAAETGRRLVALILRDKRRAS